MLIRRKLFIFRFLLIAVFCCVAVFVIHYHNYQSRIAELRYDLSNHAQHEADKIAIHVRQYLNGLRLFAASSDVRLLLAAYHQNQSIELTQLLQDHLENYRDSIIGIQRISVADASGAIVASSDSEQIGEVLDALPSTPQFFGTKSVDLGATIATQSIGPVFDTDKTIVGYVEMLAWVEPINNILSDHTFENSTGELLIAARNSQDVPRYVMQTRFNPEVSVVSASIGSIDAPLLIAATARDAMVLVGNGLYDYRGNEVYAASVVIENSPWTMIVKIDKAEALAPLYDTLRFMLLVAFAFLVFFLLVTYFGSRRFLLAFDMLARFTQQLRQENYSYRLTMNGSDDIAQLADDLNGLAEKLEHFKNKTTQERQHKINELTNQLQSLKGQLADLMAINEALVGRELRMKELKKQLNDAKKNIVKPSENFSMQDHLAELETLNKSALRREQKKRKSKKKNSTKDNDITSYSY